MFAHHVSFYFIIEAFHIRSSFVTLVVFNVELMVSAVLVLCVCMSACVYALCINVLIGCSLSCSQCVNYC